MLGQRFQGHCAGSLKFVLTLLCHLRFPFQLGSCVCDVFIEENAMKSIRRIGLHNVTAWNRGLGKRGEERTSGAALPAIPDQLATPLWQTSGAKSNQKILWLRSASAGTIVAVVARGRRGDCCVPALDVSEPREWAQPVPAPEHRMGSQSH